ncbi:MAG: ABC transporter substrate-binding protein, partial [Hyphomicrobiales bacterium]|nr:ABC transporter substrate-binding protein [Hyphomicrobiales bacterium]
MTILFTRRAALQATGAAALVALLPRPFRALADEGVETHGLSSFGELALPPDFPHLSYVNPDAPTGGVLSLQITNTSGNQNFDTFDTLNIYSWKGNGAAGMGATFDTLMSPNGDEPDSVYGLLAQSVGVSKDKLDYRFRLRPQAKFFDGARVTAADVAFSLNILKDKGHPIYAQLLRDVELAEAEGDDVAHVRFVKDRSRDAHLIVVGMPIFSAGWWKGRDFTAATLEPPLGSGPYKVKTFEQGRFIEFERAPNYWGAKLPVNLGQNNFDRLRFEYYRERQVAFEAFKAGAINYHEEYTSRFWNTAYDFPAIKEGRVKKETLHNGAPVPTQGWYLNTRREQFKDPRVREAIGLAFDFEWTNKNIMYSSYKRIDSFFPNTDMEAKGKPGPDELKLLEPFRGKLSPSVFDDPYTPPESDGSGFDRKLLKQAYDLLLSAGCKRDGGALSLPSGKPLTIEFLDFQSAMQPHTMPFIQNLGKLGIQATYRIVDAAQYKSRTDAFDFDVVTQAMGGSSTPGADLRVAYTSQAAAQNGSRNLAGVADPVVDALVETAAAAKSRAELDTACRALDRVLRAGHYWAPQWYRDTAWVAYWDAFARPDRQPKLGTGAPGTWWWDEAKAKTIG